MENNIETSPMNHDILAGKMEANARRAQNVVGQSHR